MQWYTETVVSHIDFSLEGEQKMNNLQPSDPLKRFKTAPFPRWKYCYSWCNNKTSSVVHSHSLWLCIIMHLTGRNKTGQSATEGIKHKRSIKRYVRGSLKTKRRLLLSDIKENSQVRPNTIPIGHSKYADQCEKEKEKKDASHLYIEARGDSIFWQGRACM